MKDIKISVVSPIYKGEKMLDVLVNRLHASLNQITSNYEIILVNDASPDNSWEKIKNQCALDTRVKGVNLSRNFGQHYAISAGLTLVQGEWIVVMDCDLQDQPEEIINLYNKALEGYDIVYACRNNRKDSFLKKLSSSIFYYVFNKLSGLNADKTISNFGIFHYKVIHEYNLMSDVARDFTALINYLGFRVEKIDVVHAQRLEGQSSYNLLKLLKLSIDIIISDSNKPLQFSINLGFTMAVISFFAAIYNIIANIIGIISIPGFTMTIFSIWFVGGLLLSMNGILGIYIGKIFNQVKARPLFVIQETVNIETY